MFGPQLNISDFFVLVRNNENEILVVFFTGKIVTSLAYICTPGVFLAM